MKTTTTSTSKMAMLASSAVTLVLCLLGCTSVTSTIASDTTVVEHLPPPHNLAPPGGGTTSLRRESSYEFGKVDVFIDLACPKSAEAWPFLKKVVQEQRHRAQFVFHVLPLSDDPIGYFAAKAVQVILVNSGGAYDDVKDFMDWVFRGRDIVFFDGNADMTLDAREVVTDWAVSSTSLSFTRFHSAMQDPTFDERVLEDLEDRFVLSVQSTPTVLLNGVFMMHLDGERERTDFQFFLDSPRFPSFDDDRSSRFSSSGVIGGPSSTSSSSSRSDMWEQMGEEMRESYADMVQRQEQQSIVREQQLPWKQQLDNADGVTKQQWYESASSSAFSATFSPVSTSPCSTAATSPSWGSFSFPGSSVAGYASTWPDSDGSSPSASSSSSSSTTSTSPSSSPLLSWAWPRWPSFVASLFRGRRDDRDAGGMWGWGPQIDGADAAHPAVSAAALAAKAEAVVAAAAASVTNEAVAKDPKIAKRWGRHENRMGVQGSGGGAPRARKRAIAGLSDPDEGVSGWWAGDIGDEHAGAAAWMRDGPAVWKEGLLATQDSWKLRPATGEEGKGRGREGELGSRSGELNVDFQEVVAADAVAVKQ